MSDRLKLEVVFAAVDKFIKPVKNIIQGASAASKALRDTNATLKDLNKTTSLSKSFNPIKNIREGAAAASKALRDTDATLKELNKTRDQIDAFKKAEKEAAIAANAFKGTREKIKALRDEMDRSGPPTKTMAAELEKLSRKSADLKEKYESQINTQQRLFSKLKDAGVDTHNLAEENRRLAAASVEATNASHRLTEQLQAENQKMRQLKAAQADLEKRREFAGKVTRVGVGMAAGGAAMGLPVAKSTKDYADFETAMLGVARQVNDAVDANGKLTATYYEIGNALKDMSEKMPLTANELAKILEGGARMGIQGKENLLTYTELTGVMATAFELPVDQIGEDIGKISNLYHVPIKDIRELGDTLNWLDDNAQSKGGDIIDVMKRIAGTADMVHMKYKEAAALGSTFLSLGAAPEVAATASNAMIGQLANAPMLATAKRYRQGLAMLHLNAKDLQHGMNQDATGTIIKVLEAIRRLPQDKQLEAATRLFGKEYGDDAAKLAMNLEEYRKELALVNQERAKGSMQRENDRKNGTLGALAQRAKNAVTNISTELGSHMAEPLKGALKGALEKGHAMREWAKENPKVAGGLMSVAKWGALVVSGLGALAVGAGAVLPVLAMLKFSFVTLGLANSPIIAGLGAVASRIWAVISPIGKLVAAFGLGYAAGTLLNKGLDWLLTKMLGYPASLGTVIFDMVQRIKSGFGSAMDYVRELPGRMKEAGMAMLDGMIQGINARWEALKAKVQGMAGASVDWVKERLGIHSPSRVFAELGGFTMAGFEQGITAGAGAPLEAISGLTRKMAALGAGVALSGGAFAAQGHLDTRPPLSLAAPAPAMAGGNTYQITINPPPGTSEDRIAALVEQAIQRIESRKAARQRTRLRDTE